MVEIKGGKITTINRTGINRIFRTEDLTKGGINAITLRSRTTLPKKSPEELSSREDIQVKDIVELEEVEEEDEVQDMVEEEVAQLRNGISKEDDAVREAIPIPFPHLARRTKSIMPLSVYDALRLPPLKRSAAHFVLADKSIISVASIAEDVLLKSSEYIEDALLPPVAPDDQVPSHELEMELKPLPPHLKFYRRFIKDFSKVALPLSRLLQKDVEFELSEDCMEAFDKLKVALTQAPIVRGPDCSRPFEIMCDASNYVVGAAVA
ncbi:uncharacterized protein LOC130966296 [Arachis stenosperma]|uniref:uncharacterized protein LOC130966296 n=1 Tax=Arachis stenosperma TaxID=217475 RepID=UPI0025AC4165|nr:uncharacterized protein LOC130966296 [Arachis stenosperma]